MKARIAFIVMLSLFSTSAIAEGPQYQSLTNLKTLVEQFLVKKIGPQANTKVEIAVGQLDPRLRLAYCQSPQAFLPLGYSPLSTSIVGMRCAGKKPWSIFVPVKVKMMRLVLVAAHPLNRGKILRNSDLRLESTDLNRLHNGFYSQPKNVIGLIMKRQIGNGQPLTPLDITSPTIVQRGERVTIIAKNQRIKVNMSGVALNGGGRGDIIRVRNNHSRRIIEAKIIGPQRVEVSI